MAEVKITARINAKEVQTLRGDDLQFERDGNVYDVFSYVKLKKNESKRIEHGSFINPLWIKRALIDGSDDQEPIEYKSTQDNSDPFTEAAMEKRIAADARQESDMISMENEKESMEQAKELSSKTMDLLKDNGLLREDEPVPTLEEIMAGGALQRGAENIKLTPKDELADEIKGFPHSLPEDWVKDESEKPKVDPDDELVKSFKPEKPKAKPKKKKAKKKPAKTKEPAGHDDDEVKDILANAEDRHNGKDKT